MENCGKIGAFHQYPPEIIYQIDILGEGYYKHSTDCTELDMLPLNFLGCQHDSEIARLIGRVNFPMALHEPKSSGFKSSCFL